MGILNERAEPSPPIFIHSVPLVPHCRPRAPSSPAVVAAAVVPAEGDDEDDEDDDDDEEEGDDHVGHHGRALQGCNSIDI